MTHLINMILNKQQKNPTFHLLFSMDEPKINL